jgi:hypothetical protein
MDARVEVFGDDVWREYHAVSSAREDWQLILDRHHVNYLLLDRTLHGDLLPRVEASDCWKHVDTAGPAVLFARRSPPPAALSDLR